MPPIKTASLVSGSAIRKTFRSPLFPAAFAMGGDGAIGCLQSGFASHFDDWIRSLRRGQWSLRECCSARIWMELQLTSVAQPLLFAIQSAANAGAISRFSPVLLGHSVGELLLGAAGILTSKAAIELVIARSVHQENVRGHGRMRGSARRSRQWRRCSSPDGVRLPRTTVEIVTIVGSADRLATPEVPSRRW